uniref:Aa_trans domain-containing protein n=1 Tax=Macrostomum lignano TaxID=282301 RepID=A0A1I8FNN4_9PLAT
MVRVKSRGNSTPIVEARAFSAAANSLQTSLELALCMPTNPWAKGCDALRLLSNFVVEYRPSTCWGPILQGVPGIGRHSGHHTSPTSLVAEELRADKWWRPATRLRQPQQLFGSGFAESLGCMQMGFEMLSIFAVIIINATTSVDSFFMLSGALVAYVFCRQVGIADKEKCRSTLRMPRHTWYLANDMQMYLLSPLLLLPFVFGGLIVGSVASVVVVAGSMVCTGVLNYQYGFRRGHLNFVPERQTGTTIRGEDVLRDDLHQALLPHGRLRDLEFCLATSWPLGRPSGCPKLVALLCWAIAAAGGLALLYLVQGQIADTGPPLTLQQVTVYWSFLRPGFALCVAWVVFACVYGYGGPVNELLSWSWFTPLARLSYSVPTSVMFAFFNTYDSKFHLSDSMLIMIYLASIMLTFLVSLVLSMLVEAPLLGLEKALRAGGGSGRRRTAAPTGRAAPQPGKANDYYYSNGGYEGGPSSNRFEMRSTEVGSRQKYPLYFE